MIIEIIKHTPTWVFILFFVLLGLGISRIKTQNIPLARAVTLPIVMSVLSLFGVLADFHSVAPALIAWMVAVGLTVSLSQRLGYPKGIVFNPVTRLLSIPGSWVPLLLMIGLFFIKYAVAIVLAMHPGLAEIPFFVVFISMIYGLVSGVFLARSISIWKAVINQSVAQVVGKN